MTVYVVSSLRRYENDEEYFGADRIFTSREAAEFFVDKMINDITTGADKEVHDLLYGENDEFADEVIVSGGSIRDRVHIFRWDIATIELDALMELSIYNCLSRSFDEEDVQNVLQTDFDGDQRIEDVGLTDVYNVPDPILDRMIDKYHDYVANNDTWATLARWAISDVLDEMKNEQNESQEE